MVGKKNVHFWNFGTEHQLGEEAKGREEIQLLLL